MTLRCRRCRRPLTDEQSIRRGYGHECWALMIRRWEQELDPDPYFPAPPRTYTQRTLPPPPRHDPHYVVVPREALEEAIQDAEWARGYWGEDPAYLGALRSIVRSSKVDR